MNSANPTVKEDLIFTVNGEGTTVEYRTPSGEYVYIDGMADRSTEEPFLGTAKKAAGRSVPLEEWRRLYKEAVSAFSHL